MPRGVWSPKRERQYEHIKASCLSKCKTKRCSTAQKKRCTRIAAATVNRDRARYGETRGRR